MVKDFRPRKPLRWWGNSLKVVRDLPDWAQQAAGFNIDLLQAGEDPHDWKSRPDLGAGTIQIFIGRRMRPSYRVMAVARFPEAIYILHVFEKRSQKTSRFDNEATESRYKALTNWRHEQGYR